MIDILAMNLSTKDDLHEALHALDAVAEAHACGSVQREAAYRLVDAVMAHHTVLPDYVVAAKSVARGAADLADCVEKYGMAPMGAPSLDTLVRCGHEARVTAAMVQLALSALEGALACPSTEHPRIAAERAKREAEDAKRKASKRGR